MIVKHFELDKKKLINNKYFLIYGNNKGLVEEITQEILLPNLPKEHFRYEEIEILKNLENFKTIIFNKSFFENEKLIIISRVTDKILSTIENIISVDLNDLSLILLSETLDKKSKIRKYFERETKTICVPVYDDNFQTLSTMVSKFMKEKNINISREMINIIVDRAAGDRINLKNELKKIESFAIKKKKLVPMTF